jgi:hypothetical protein
MYANAMAISRLATMQGDMETSRKFAEKAAILKTDINRDL